MGEAARAELTRKYGELPPGEGGAWLFEVTRDPAATRATRGYAR